MNNEEQLKKELLELIKTGEGYTLEFKESFTSSIGREICAFANASGGNILLGVRDDNSIRGIKLSNDLSSKIQTIIRNIDPKLNVIFELVEDVVVISVPEGNDKPYAVNKEFYLRQGSNSQKLTRDEILEFFRNSNKISFEKQVNNDFDLKKDFDNYKFESFIAKTNIPKNLSKNHILKNLNLLTTNKPNNACVLLFPHRVTKFFLSADISCVLYAGQSIMLDKKVFDADLISNFENALQFILRNIKTRADIVGVRRVETPEIPEKALREAILNAMIHRDYFIEGRILINIFEDRVEIFNPGKLLFPPEELGKISITRNPILADCMHRAGFVEKIGSGIKRIKDLVPDVEIKTSSDWFMVTFKRKQTEKIRSKSDANRTQIGRKSDEKERQIWIIQYLKENKTIKSKDIIDKFKIAKDTAVRDLKDLIEQKLIVKKGAGNNIWYELKDV